MTTDNEAFGPFFRTFQQIAAERGAKYAFGRDWASVDSTQDGERIVAEAGFYLAADNSPYYVLEVFEVDGKTFTPADASTGTDSSDLYRKLGQWV